MSTSLRSYRELLFRYLRPQRWRVFWLALFLLVNIGLQLVNPQLISLFINTASGRGSESLLMLIALLFVLTSIVTQMCGVAEAYMAENMAVLTTNLLRADLLAHCLQLDSAFHSAHTPGELTQRIDGDVSQLGNFFSRFIIQILGNVLLVFAVLVLSFAIDWRMGLTLGIFAILTLVFLERVRNNGVKAWTRASAADAEVSGFLEEHLSGTEDIRANGANRYVIFRLAERAKEQLVSNQLGILKGIGIFQLNIIFLMLSLAVALGLGGILFLQHQLSLGNLYLIFAYSQLLNAPIQSLSRELRDLQRASASIIRTEQILATVNPLKDEGRLVLPTELLSICFDGVTFAYEENTPVLHNISWTLAAGSVIGILGRTGSGKTTLTRLLFRLYDPSVGSVRINGCDVRDYALSELRKQIGMVTQDVQLFHASVRDNLTFFDHTIPDERILEILFELGLEKWYRDLPNGLASTLAPDSSGLSAGEAQLLAFARVFLQDPRIVILDEASSRLDPATEQELEHAIERLLHGRTALIIAHRLLTIERADTVLILEEGRVCEYGEREQLAKDGQSRFAQLLALGMEEFVR